MKNKWLSVLVILTLTQPALAQIYSCGDGCYTTNPKRGAQKAHLENKLGSYTSVMRTIPKTSPSVAQAEVAPSTRASMHHAVRKANTIAHNTPVSVSTAPHLSSARASGRRTILEQELTNERSALAQAQKALADGRAVSGQSDATHQNRVRQLESAVLDRQQNIQALQRELSRM